MVLQDTPRAGRSRATWLVAGAVFALALAVRLLYLFSAPDRGWPHALYYEGDAPLWVDFAIALHNGVPFESDLPIRSPGVAYLLNMFGPSEIDAALPSGAFNFVGFKTAWCVAAAAACGLAFVCVRREFGLRPALIASALCTFSFASYVISTSLNNEALYTLALMIVVWGSLRLRHHPSGWCAVALGVAHGGATLLRPEHTLLFVMMSAHALWSHRSRRGDRRDLAARIAPRLAAGLTGAAVVGFVAVCLPWSVRGGLATARFNATAERLPDYDDSPIPWNDGARAFLDALPAFARADNFAYLSHLCQSEGDTTVTPARVKALLEREFGYVPEPLTPWTWVSSQGPLSFALANHPRSDGGFTKAALDNRFGVGQRLHLALPSHLRLYNHGYSVGLGYIREDIGRWLRLVGAKLARFADGMTMGFTGYNLPYGRGGVRRPVDLITPRPGAHTVWRAAMIALVLSGACVAVRRRTGAVWLMVIGYKLIVTILFYGYARQAVSILPAVYTLGAVGADAMLGATSRWVAPGGRTRWAMSAVVIMAAVMIDVHAATHTVPMRIRGRFEHAARWGDQAVESFERIEIEPVTGNKPDLGPRASPSAAADD